MISFYRSFEPTQTDERKPAVNETTKRFARSLSDAFASDRAYCFYIDTSPRARFMRMLRRLLNWRVKRALIKD